VDRLFGADLKKRIAESGVVAVRRRIRAEAPEMLAPGEAAQAGSRTIPPASRSPGLTKRPESHTLNA
jgi:hypothetical protein